MKRPLSPAKLQKICDDWNKINQVGIIVEYHPVIGERPFRTRVTKSVAQVLSGHTPVIWLKDESGCVALDAVNVASPEVAGLFADIWEAEGLACSRETNDPTGPRARLDDLRKQLRTMESGE